MLKQSPVSTLTAVMLMSLSLGSFSAELDTPEITQFQKLHPGLAQSVYHRVENVSVDGHYYRFQVGSQFGRYDIVSLAMLRVRVHEFRVLGEAIAQFAQSEQQLSDALQSQLRISTESAIDLLAHPLETVTETSGNLWGNQNGNHYTEEENTLNFSSHADGQTTDRTLTIYKRNVANQWGLDVYSSNPAVQKFLSTVAKVRESGLPAAGAPHIGSHLGTPLKISVPGLEDKISHLLHRNNPAQLRQQNNEILVAMHIPERIRTRFFQQSNLSPRHQTRIIHYLKQLEGVRNRVDFIQSAISVENEFTALAFEETAVMMVYYHHNVRQLEKIHAGKNLLHAITVDEHIVTFLPVDVIQWSPQTERLFNNLASEAGKSGYSAWELVTAGILTSETHSQLLKRRFILSENFIK